MKIYQNIRLFSILLAVLFFSTLTSFSQQNEQFVVQTNGFTFDLQQCKISGGTVLCYFTVTSNDFDRKLNLTFWRFPKLFDNSGNEYRIRTVKIGNQGENANLVANVPTQMITISEDFKSPISEISLLSVWFNSENTFEMSLRKIPIGHNLKANNQEDSSKSPNNIAYKKNVYISTNGEDDIPDNGTDCNNPSEITDGSLNKGGNCATDGVMGFQNNELNQLMEVTVTINLQQTYNITKIRYNQGNVWGGGTWNADWMITPFGKTQTKSGSQDKGAWTEQTGSLNASRVQITFQKTKKKWNEDWLTIGEIEIIGTPINKANNENGQDSNNGGRYSKSIAYPSATTKAYTSGKWISLNYPNNWQVKEEQNSVWFAPEGAYGNSGITHGALIGIAQTRSSNLGKATEDYVNSLLQSNSYLQKQNGYSRTRFDNRQAYATVLSGRSPITGETEVVTVYTTQLRNGQLFYFATVAPQSVESKYNNAFLNILSSIRLND